MKLFGCSQRDLNIAVRALSELRTIQATDTRAVLSNTVETCAAVLRSASAEVDRIDRVLDHIEHHVVTVLRDGHNLPSNLSGRERRDQVQASRDALEKILADRETERERRRDEARKAAAKARANQAMAESAAPVTEEVTTS